MPTAAQPAPTQTADLPPWQAVVAHGRGVAATPGLADLLGGWALLPPSAAGQAQGVLAWGRKPSAARAARFAHARGLPLLTLEDAFLRSVLPGAAGRPYGIAWDDLGIYYDASAPSRLEHLITRPLGTDALLRAEALRQAWCAQRVSKYNHAREGAPPPPGAVLVVDQTLGDASIAFGGADAAAFSRMLQAALDEHPAAPVLLKVHPDVIAGRKRGHFAVTADGRLAAGTAAATRVQVIAQDAHPCGLLEGVQAVYTVTSQMGFEALLWGRPVRCFGMPFYAGWGLTQDELAAPARRRGPASAGVALAALVHAALIDYARYLDPDTGQPCPPERLIEWMGLQRRQRARFSPQVHAVGFSRWKRPFVRDFFAGSQVRFASARAPVSPGATVAVWGRKPLPGGAAPAQTVRLEDGFLRSVGLGADLVRPLSWVMDTTGMYYDATAPSDLERLLQHTEFDDALRARAAALREALVASGITKYNVGQAAWQRPPQAAEVVLAVGQVESDAAVALGAPGLRTNLALLQAARAAHPRAHVVYKPHPDVVARLRQAGQGEDSAARWCDEIVVDPPMATLLAQVDTVHVISSLAGFEALLRGRTVVTHGCPFYAGWGLTIDQHPVPRRQRTLALDDLVAAALLLYPTYVSRRSGAFTTAEGALRELREWRDTEGPTRATPARRLLRTVLRWTQGIRGAPR